MNFLRIEQTMILESPAKINRTVVDGKTYATDEKGKGLYILVPADLARYDGEGSLIDGSFKIGKRWTEETKRRKISERVRMVNKRSNS